MAKSRKKQAYGKTSKGLIDFPVINNINGMATTISPDSLDQSILNWADNATLNTMGTVTPRPGYSTFTNYNKILKAEGCNPANFQSVGTYATTPGDGTKFVSLIDGKFFTSDNVPIPLSSQTKSVKLINALYQKNDEEVFIDKENKVGNLITWGYSSPIGEMPANTKVRLIFKLAYNGIEFEPCNITSADNTCDFSQKVSKEFPDQYTSNFITDGEGFITWNNPKNKDQQYGNSAYSPVSFFYKSGNYVNKSYLTTKDSRWSETFSDAFLRFQKSSEPDWKKAPQLTLNYYYKIGTKNWIKVARSINITSTMQIISNELSIKGEFIIDQNLVANKTGNVINFFSGMTLYCQIRNYRMSPTSSPQIGVSGLLYGNGFDKDPFYNKDAKSTGVKVTQAMPTNFSQPVVVTYLQSTPSFPFSIDQTIKDTSWLTHKDTLYCISGDKEKGIIEFPFSKLASTAPKASMITPYVPSFTEISQLGLNCLGDGGFIDPSHFSETIKSGSRLVMQSIEDNGENFIGTPKSYTYMKTATTTEPSKYVNGKKFINNYPYFLSDICLTPLTPIKLEKPIKVVGQQMEFSIVNWDTYKWVDVAESSTPLGFSSGSPDNQKFTRLSYATQILINPSLNGKEVDPTTNYFPQNVGIGTPLKFWDSIQFYKLDFKDYPPYYKRLDVNNPKTKYYIPTPSNSGLTDKPASFFGYTIFNNITSNPDNIVNGTSSTDNIVEGTNGDSFKYNNTLITDLTRCIIEYGLNGKLPKIYNVNIVSTSDYGVSRSWYPLSVLKSTAIRDVWLENLVIKLAKIINSSDADNKFSENNVKKFFASFVNLSVSLNFDWKQYYHPYGSDSSKKSYNIVSLPNNGASVSFAKGSNIVYTEDLIQTGINKLAYVHTNIIVPSIGYDKANQNRNNIVNLMKDEVFPSYPIQTDQPATLPYPKFHRTLVKPVPENAPEEYLNFLLNTDPLADLQPKTGYNTDLSGWTILEPTWVPDGTATTGIPYKIDEANKKANFYTNLKQYFPNSNQFVVLTVYYEDGEYTNDPYKYNKDKKENEQIIYGASTAKLFKLDLQKEFSAMQTPKELYNCPYGIINNGRLLIYGGKDRPNRMYFSQPNQFDYFPNNNYVDFPFALNEHFQRIVNFQNVMVAATNVSWYKILYDKTLGYLIEPINQTIGALDRDAIVQFQNDIYFLWRDNIYKLSTPNLATGDTNRLLNVKPVGTAISSLIYTTTKNYSKAGFRVYASVKNSEIRFLVPQLKMAGEDKGLIINYQPLIPKMLRDGELTSGFSTSTSRGVYDPVKKTFGSGIFDNAKHAFSEEGYYFIYNNGVMYKEDDIVSTDYCDTTTDENGVQTSATYDMLLITKDDNFNDPMKDKNFLYCEVLYSSPPQEPFGEIIRSPQDIKITLVPYFDGKASPTLAKRKKEFSDIINIHSVAYDSINKDKNLQAPFTAGYSMLDETNSFEADFHLSGAGGPKNTIKLQLTFSGKNETTPLTTFNVRQVLVRFVEVPKKLFGSGK